MKKMCQKILCVYDKALIKLLKQSPLNSPKHKTFYLLISKTTERAKPAF